MSSVVGDDTSHSHGRGTFQQSLCDDGISLGGALQSSSDGQDTVMNTLNNLAHASLDSGLITEVSDVLATFADNDTSFLGGHDGADGQNSLRIFFLGLGDSIGIALTDVQSVETIIDSFFGRARDGILRSRHG